LHAPPIDQPLRRARDHTPAAGREELVGKWHCPRKKKILCGAEGMVVVIDETYICFALHLVIAIIVNSTFRDYSSVCTCDWFHVKNSFTSIFLNQNASSSTGFNLRKI
jgi:hypothetical protein